jgi:hypothetical protein
MADSLEGELMITPKTRTGGPPLPLNQQVFILGGESLLSRVAGVVAKFDVTKTGMAAS